MTDRTITHELADQLACAFERAADEIRTTIVKVDEANVRPEVSEALLLMLVGAASDGAAKVASDITSRLGARAKAMMMQKAPG